METFEGAAGSVGVPAATAAVAAGVLAGAVVAAGAGALGFKAAN